MNEYRLKFLKEEIRRYKKLTDDLRKGDSHKFKIIDLQFYVFEGVKLCERLLCFYLEKEGFCVNHERGIIKLDERYKSLKAIDNSYNIHVFDFCIQKEGLLPDECLKLISLIKDNNFNKICNENITYEIAVSFFDAIDSFLLWFDEETNEELSISDVIGNVFGAGAIVGAALLPILPVVGAFGIASSLFGKSGTSSKDILGMRHKYKSSKKKDRRGNAEPAQLENDLKLNGGYEDVSPNNIAGTLSFSNNEQHKNNNEKDSLQSYDKKMFNQKDASCEVIVREKEERLKDIEEKLNILLLLEKRHSEETKKGFDKIGKQIEQLSGQIDAYQSLIERQIGKAANEQEVERLISAFADECVERLAKRVRANTEEKIIKIETERLILSLGDNCWAKLDEKSREYLISAKVFFSKLLEIEGINDYSGVCLSITKALEVELYKRFYANYMKYLDEKYNNDYTKYPTALLYKRKKSSKSEVEWKPLRPESFTMGTIAFVLCIKNDYYDSQQRIENNKARLLEYSKECLLSRYSESDIEQLLTNYANAIEKIRVEYRNRCSHRESIKQLQAKECMNYVIDVEKLLKQMIDSFDE